MRSHRVLGSNPEIQEIKELKNIIETEKNQSERLYKAKLIAQKLDAKTKINDTKNMINSIAAKIKIIEEFS
jgi:hypothetical protein